MKRKLIINLDLRIIRNISGKLGNIVIKQYQDKTVLSKLPDMSRIKPSALQQLKRNSFKEAVAYAQWIISDEKRKTAFQSHLPFRKRRKVYQQAISYFLKRIENSKNKNRLPKGVITATSVQVICKNNAPLSIVNKQTIVNITPKDIQKACSMKREACSPFNPSPAAKSYQLIANTSPAAAPYTHSAQYALSSQTAAPFPLPAKCALP